MGRQTFVDWKGNAINKEIHGGNRAAYFICFMVVTTNITFAPNVVNMVSYLHGTMHMSIATCSTTITNFIGVTCAFALLGGLLSDSYMTRFKTILVFGPFEFLGFSLLSMQAHISSLRPPPCNSTAQRSSCEHIHGSRATLLHAALYTLALGEGCMRANLASFGGDQFDGEDSTESRKKSSFFNWFALSVSMGNLIGLFLIVWIENHKGWDIGFGLSACLILLGWLATGSGFLFYRHQRPRGSPVTRIIQVFVVALKNRKLVLPEDKDELYQEQLTEEITGGELLDYTTGFRCLDKASIHCGSSKKWSLCSVTQVEETKIVLRMFPIFMSSVIGYTPIPLLLTLTIQQGGTMKTELGNIVFSTSNLLIIPVVLQILLLVAYDRLFVPLARHITGYRTGITHLQRVGVGFLANSAAICVAAVIEMKRKSVAERYRLKGGPVPMSAMWLVFQLLAWAMTEVFTFVGLLELFNSEVSKGMKSLGTAIFWCIIGSASFMGSILVHVVNRATRHGVGKMGWLEGNSLDKSCLDRFYWLLAAIEAAGFLNFAFWASRYAYRRDPNIATI